MKLLLNTPDTAKTADLRHYLDKHRISVYPSVLQSKQQVQYCWYLRGPVGDLSQEKLRQFSCITDILTTSSNATYPLLQRPDGYNHNYGFYYQDIPFFQDEFQLFMGLNAVDNPDSVEAVFKQLQAFDLKCARMGAFKPRTHPYSFQGLGVDCLPYVFELAGKYNISVLAMEITHEAQLEAIDRELAKQNYPTGVLLQIGTRNAQNFELLKAVGKQTTHPVLYKRGFGITLEESLSACEYLARQGNTQIIFCLRGMKSLFAAPHRNFVDFSLVSTLKRLTTMPICVDPSHAIGNTAGDHEGISDIFHVTAQGIISGANMLLIDVHACPKQALVDSAQAIALKDLPWYLEDIQLTRESYLKRKQLAERYL